jgi:tetratricopeptide (TPR) repeat protein
MVRASGGKLGSRRAALRLRDRAWEAARDAVETYREISKADPSVERELASALIQLSALLGALGRRKEALAVAEEAVDLLHRLDPDADDTRSALADGLQNLATRFHRVGKLDRCLEATREALPIVRALAAKNPSRYRPELAGGLGNLAVILSDLQDMRGALRAAEESAALQRQLAAERPDVFIDDLAQRLSLLAAVRNCSSTSSTGPTRRSPFPERASSSAVSFASKNSRIRRPNSPGTYTPSVRSCSIEAVTKKRSRCSVKQSCDSDRPRTRNRSVR